MFTVIQFSSISLPYLYVPTKKFNAYAARRRIEEIYRFGSNVIQYIVVFVSDKTDKGRQEAYV